MMKSAKLSPQKQRNSLVREINETDRVDVTKSKIYLRMLLRLGERFGTNQANAPMIEEVLNDYLLKRPMIAIRRSYVIFIP